MSTTSAGIYQSPWDGWGFLDRLAVADFSESPAGAGSCPRGPADTNPSWTRRTDQSSTKQDKLRPGPKNRSSRSVGLVILSSVSPPTDRQTDRQTDLRPPAFNLQTPWPWQSHPILRARPRGRRCRLRARPPLCVRINNTQKRKKKQKLTRRCLHDTHARRVGSPVCPQQTPQMDPRLPKKAPRLRLDRVVLHFVRSTVPPRPWPASRPALAISRLTASPPR